MIIIRVHVPTTHLYEMNNSLNNYTFKDDHEIIL
jgi:hypothetical protein